MGKGSIVIHPVESSSSKANKEAGVTDKSSEEPSAEALVTEASVSTDHIIEEIFVSFPVDTTYQPELILSIVSAFEIFDPMSEVEAQLVFPSMMTSLLANVDELLRSFTEAIQYQLNQEGKAQETGAPFAEEESVVVDDTSPVQPKLSIPYVVVPEDLFVPETLLQLIAHSKDSSEELSKSAAVDIPESSSKAFENPSETELVVPVVEPIQTDFVVVPVDTVSQGSL